jgi:hypothetical protein
MAVLVGLVVLALGVATVAFDLHRYLTLSGLQELHVGLSLAYAEAPLPVVLGFMGLIFLSTALSLPGATLLSLVAGAVFGRGLGLVVASVSATLGALVAMLMARYLLRDAVPVLPGQPRHGPDRHARLDLHLGHSARAAERHLPVRQRGNRTGLAAVSAGPVEPLGGGVAGAAGRGAGAGAQNDEGVGPAIRDGA